MIHTLLDNLGSLVLAFILALMVWMVAVTQGQGPPVTRMFPEDGLTIEPINIPEGLVISEKLDQRVKVKVRAPQSNLSSLSPSDFRVYVNLSNLSPGLHEVPVQVKCPPCDQKRVNKLEWEPDRIAVKLEEMAERKVPVKSNLQGSTAVGYQAKMPTVDPEEVTVSGPRSLVEQVSAARADIYLFDADSRVEKSVTLAAVDADSTLVSGVNLNPRRADVVVPVVPAGHRKEVAVTPNIKGNVALGYYASGISVTPQTVVLTGLPSRIREAPGFVETEPVSIAGAKQSVEVQVPIHVPEGLQLSDPVNQLVTVKVEVNPFIGGRTFEITPSIRNLAPGFEAEVSPPKVQVFLSGPLPELEALTESDIQVILDLSELQPGRHRIKPTVVVGRESLETRTLPEEVEVTLVELPTPTSETPPTQEPAATLTPTTPMPGATPTQESSAATLAPTPQSGSTPTSEPTSAPRIMRSTPPTE